MEDVYSRIERFRYYFVVFEMQVERPGGSHTALDGKKVVFEIAGVGSRYRSMNLSEST